jgi:hypothetical protein
MLRPSSILRLAPEEPVVVEVQRVQLVRRVLE